MDNFEKQQRTRVEEARDAIVGASDRIEEEFHRTANSWLTCFGSSVFVVETYLSGRKVAEELGTEKYNIVQERLQALKQRLHDLKQQYPEKNTTPPNKMKQELLAMLDVLK